MDKVENNTRQLVICGDRETPSKAVWFGMGYITYILEIIRNLSTGASPVCLKPVGRAVANHMGESERIAVKYMASEYTGRVIESRNTIISCG
jgi:DNA-binding protein